MYLGNRRFLPIHHRYRRLRAAFNGSTEEEKSLNILTGDQVYDKVKNLITSYGKAMRRNAEKNVWKK